MTTSLVAIRLRSVEDEIEAIEAAWLQGEAVLPLDPEAPDAVAADLLRRLRPAAVVTNRPDGTARKVIRLEDGAPVPDGTALVVATSGSTGQPKGVVLSHAALDASARASLERLGCAPGDRWLLDLPLHHVAGLQVVRRAAMLGTDPVVAATGGTLHEADWAALVPTQLQRLVDAGHDLVDKGVLLGGAAASDDLLARSAEAGARVTRSYGMTETCGGCVYDGRPLDGVEVEVGDDGLVRIRGRVVADGFRHADGSVAPVVDQDGWFVTSDLGRIDDGIVSVLGRADEVIITGGENVAAEAVAAVLRRHEQVADAAVFGEIDEEWGERVVAVVVATDPADPPALSDLRAHVASYLGRHAAPKQVRFVVELPRTTLGKVDRAALPSSSGRG